MKVGMLLLAGFVCAAGCESPKPTSRGSSVQVNPGVSNQQGGKLITEFGKEQFGNTVITADAQTKKISLAHLLTSDRAGMKSESRSEMSPGTWTLEDGWFAYVQNDGDYVWLHDGGNGLLLVERKISKTQHETNTYGVENFVPVPVPEEVLSRLDEPLRTRAKQARIQERAE